MEKDKDGGLTFNGFDVGKKSRQNAEDLAVSILKRGSVDDLRRDLQSQGFGLSEIDTLLSTLSKRPTRGEVSEERKRALEKLQDVRFSVIGTPPSIREHGDAVRGESGKGRLTSPDKFIPED